MSDNTKLAAEFLYRTQFGLATAPSHTNPEEISSIAKALFSAINGDSEISPDERSWVKGYFAAKGYSAEIVASIDTMKALPVDQVAPLMTQGTLKFAGSALIYDAVRACSADGHYADGERAVVARLGKSLDVSAETISAIEGLVRDEQALLERRIKVLFPKGHPNLNKRYQR